MPCEYTIARVNLLTLRVATGQRRRHEWLADESDCQATMNDYLSHLRLLLLEQERQRAGQFNDFDYGGAACMMADDYHLQRKIDLVKRDIAALESGSPVEGTQSRRGSISSVILG
jgi:hypothetical protein